MTCSASRLVTSCLSPGQSRSSSATVGAAAVTCSKLSKTRSIGCDPICSLIASRSGRSLCSCTPIVRAVTARNGLDVPTRAQVDEVHPVVEVVAEVTRHLHRQPRLAGAAGAEQREQAGAAEALLDLPELADPADETVERRGQIAGRAAGGRSQGAQRVELGLQLGMHHLEDVLGLGQAAQLVRSEIQEVDAGRRG